MSTHTFRQKLLAALRLLDAGDFDRALAEVEKLSELWVGNPQLRILWASLVQLQENASHDLDAARAALHQAIDLDGTSPAARLELGHFLDNVDDDPKAAAKVFAEGVALARQQLIEGLIGRAKALLQLDKRKEAVECVSEAMQLLRSDPELKRSARLQDLIDEVLFARSA